MKESRVRQIAEGRVYCAGLALKLKLVDALGSVDDAVAYAAEKAGMAKDGYGVAIYPKYKPDFWDIMKAEGLDQLNQSLGQIAGQRPESALIYEAARILKREPVQARMTPLSIRFD